MFARNYKGRPGAALRMQYKVFISKKPENCEFLAHNVSVQELSGQWHAGNFASGAERMTENHTLIN